ncbi:MAG: class I SAM-dependent methyltransferase [Acidobacteria bacterium]|nr:class I SAM-dependent methyltransferase [Acidobacteriota bacterium]
MRGFEQIPWLYDPLMVFLERCGLGRWRRWLTHGARGRVLEIGCGTGRNLHLYPDETRPVALEPDLRVLLAARRRAPSHGLLVARAESLPFADGAFDVSSLVFCSVADPALGLLEIHRVLRRGGDLRMLEHVRSEHPVAGRIQDWIQPLWTRVAGGCHPNRSTEAAVLEAGFEIEENGRRRSGTMRRFVARHRDGSSVD